MTFKITLAATALAMALSGTAQAQGLFGWGGSDEASVPAAESTSGKMAADTAAEFPDVTEMVLGEADAPVEIIEYASYTCPHCANFHQSTFKQLKKDYIDTGKVRFVFREVYFDKYGMWASLLARCSGPERFFGVTDLAGSIIELSFAGGHGTIAGMVKHLSGDAIQDEELGLVYDSRVAMATTEIFADGRNVDLTPGMSVTVEIKTGKRKIIEFLLSPLMRYQDEALRER